MSKIHLILILLIIATVGGSIYLLMEEGEIEKKAPQKKVTKSSNVFTDSRIKPEVDGKDYIQGILEVPNLEEGFKRCLSRGFSPVELKILRESRDIFEDHVFDEGKFSWNKVIYIDEYGEKMQIFLGEDLKLKTSKKMDDGTFKQIELAQLNNLEELKDRLAGKQVLLNEYSQTFKKNGLVMELLLSDGVMKFLKVKSPKKKVVCKP